MNETFNLKRFLSLLKRDIRMCSKYYLYISIALLGILLIVAIFSHIIMNITGPNNGYHGNFIIVYFALIAAIFCSPFYLRENNNKQEALFSYILPSSALERFLSVCARNLIVLVICAIVLILANFVWSIIAISFSHDLTVDIKIDSSVITAILSMQAIAILGQAYFRKFALVKTFGITTLLLYLTLMLAMGVTEPNSYLDLEDFIFPERISQQWLSTVHPTLYVCGTILKLIFPFGLWFAAYFKMKETEI